MAAASGGLEHADVGLEVRGAGAQVRVGVAEQHLDAGSDVRVDVDDAVAGPHAVLSLSHRPPPVGFAISCLSAGLTISGRSIAVASESVNVRMTVERPAGPPRHLAARAPTCAAAAGGCLRRRPARKRIKIAGQSAPLAPCWTGRASLPRWRKLDGQPLPSPTRSPGLPAGTGTRPGRPPRPERHGPGPGHAVGRPGPALRPVGAGPPAAGRRGPDGRTAARRTGPRHPPPGPGAICAW